MAVVTCVCPTSFLSPTVLWMTFETHCCLCWLGNTLGKHRVMTCKKSDTNHQYVNENSNPRYPIANSALLRNKQHWRSYMISHLAVCNHRYWSALHIKIPLLAYTHAWNRCCFFRFHFPFNKGHFLMTIVGWRPEAKIKARNSVLVYKNTSRVTNVCT